MKTMDLVRMCLQNLARRKTRTLLTVLGVVVGACSIIIMISIGVGMRESQEKMLAEMTDLTLITVYPASANPKAPKLDGKALAEMRALPGAVFATPKQQAEDFQIRYTAGRDRRFAADYASLLGMEADAPAKLGYQIVKGSPLSGKPGEVIVGGTFAYQFKDTKRPEGANMVDIYGMYSQPTTGGESAESARPDPYFDPLGATIEMIFEVGEAEKAKTFSYKFKVVGIMKEDMSRGSETGDGIVMNIDEMNRIIAEVRRNAGLKADKKAGYQQVLVKARDIGTVASVEAEIKRMGFSTNSMESIRKPMEQEAQQKQMMLGGLGAISLFVAALGITNTMIMSISERMREIGIMKALGCFVKDVRAVFLLEAGCIGLIGGIMGIIISSVISIAMNLARSQSPIGSLEEAITLLTTKGSRISVIPLWLLGFALLFSILIGLGSGYYPANKAVRISALEAIKHE